MINMICEQLADVDGVFGLSQRSLLLWEGTRVSRDMKIVP